MGISREVAEAVLAAIRADAAASGTGKARTARVIAALAAMDITATAPAIRILAGSIGIELERAAEPGKGGGGRPLGSRDQRERRTRSDMGSVKDSTKELAAKAREVYARTCSLRRAGEELGISAERVRQLIATDDQVK